MSPLPFVEELKRRNRALRDSWDAAAEHRRHVARLLCDAADGRRRPRRLCVVGAGNCNDLSLPELLDAYDEVHLVDIDGRAVEEGVARQAPTAAARIKTHGRMDVTGCLAELTADLNPASATSERVAAWVERINGLPPFPRPSPFHVVVSLAVLTQLAEAALFSVGGPAHPRGNELLFALRNHHLRKLVEMTRSGGTAILVTDVVSSFTFPNLPLLADAELTTAMGQQVALKNFFTGANPYAIEAFCRNDSRLGPAALRVSILPPWRWNQGNRTLLMSGVSIAVR